MKTFQIMLIGARHFFLKSNTPGNTLGIILLYSWFTLVCFEKGYGQTTPESRATQWDEWMKTELNLSLDQQARAHEINVKYARQNEAIKDVPDSKRKKFQMLKEVDKNKAEELKQIFTADQFRKYENNKRDIQKHIRSDTRK